MPIQDLLNSPGALALLALLNTIALLYLEKLRRNQKILIDQGNSHHDALTTRIAQLETAMENAGTSIPANPETFRPPTSPSTPPP